MYCGECGAPVAAPSSKPASARLPWVLSAVVLVGFSLVLAQLVQRGSVRRSGDMGVTGGISAPASGGSAGGAPAAGGAAASSSAGMPSIEDLAAMTPREAADRLYERAMSEHEVGNIERAAFFLDMGLRAYAAVPPSDIDADAHFHIGMMQLLRGDSTMARSSASAILDEVPDHLLGLILLARIADFSRDAKTATDLRARLRAAVDAAGGIPDRPEYQSHRPLIERELKEGS